MKRKMFKSIKILSVLLLTLVMLSACQTGNNNVSTKTDSEPTKSATSQPSSQDKYPDHEIRVIIPWTPGGGNDTAARIIAPYMEKELGVPLIIDNQGGGAGLVGTTIMTAAPKDGYTIGVFSSPSTPDLAYLQNNPSWGPEDLAYLGAFNDEPQCIIVDGKSEWKTLAELIETAKGKTLNVGATGPIGVSTSVIVELAELTGADFNFVQFDGTPEVITALYGGHIDVAFRPGDRYSAEHEDGTLRILAVASDKRLSALPEVPTIKEVLGTPVLAKSFRGWWAPAGIPENRMKMLRDAFDKVMNNPEVQKKITDAVAEFSYTPYEPLTEQMNASIEKWRVMLPKLQEWATK